MAKRVNKGFAEYLKENFSKDITEFRLVLNSALKLYIHPTNKDGESLDYNIDDNDVITCVTQHADDCKCGNCFEVCRCGHDQKDHKKVPSQGPDHPAMVVCCADKFCFCYKYEVAK